MNQALNILSENSIHAIGWTLLHSLWQGAILALILSLVLMVLHHYSSKTRYIIASGALLAQVAASSITFLYLLNKLNPAGIPSQNSKYTLDSFAASPSGVVSTGSNFWETPITTVLSYFEQHMSLLVSLWLLGFALMALRFIGGLAYTQRLKNHKTKPLAEQWQQRVIALCHKLKINKSVRLVESAMVKVPMTIGFAKPIVLMPIGAITGLSQAQVEAVLAHELAHIMRRDYFFNIIQSFIDMLFFYHPAMWWISGAVRAERENCCDDIAVELCGDRLIYAQTLVELEEMQLTAAPTFAMSFSGKRGSLITRIKRLVGQSSLRPSLTEGFAAALLLVAGLSIITVGAFANFKKEDKALNDSKVTLQPREHFTDNVSRTYMFTAQDSTGQKRDVVIIKNKKGKVTELYVDGKRIPKKNMSEFNNLIEQRLQAIEKAPKAEKQEVRVEIEKEQRTLAKAQAPKHHKYEYKYQIILDGDSASTMGLPPLPPLPPTPRGPRLAPPPPMPPMPPLAPLSDNKEDRKKYNETVKKYEKEMQQFQQKIKDYETVVKRMHEGAIIDTQRVYKDGRHNEKVIIKRIERDNEKSKMHEERVVERKITSEARHERMEAIKKEMVKDGLLKKEADDLSIQMTNDTLVVNGKKQSKELYEKYKELLDLKPEGNSNFKFQLNIK